MQAQSNQDAGLLQPTGTKELTTPLSIIGALLLLIFIAGPSIRNFSLTELLSTYKNYYLSYLWQEDSLNIPLSGTGMQERAQQVHYIAELIKGNGARLDDSHKRLALAIVKESMKANYDPLFVAAVIKAESRFNRHAVSIQGAKGLMQLMPSTAKYISSRKGLVWLGSAMLNDPEYNLRLGIAYLKYLERYFGKNREKILIAYNWGPGNLLKAQKGQQRVPYVSAKYARTVINTHSRWRNDLDTRMVRAQAPSIGSLLS